MVFGSRLAFLSPVDGGNIITVGYFLHLPAVGFKALFNILRAGNRRGTGKRNLVIIIKGQLTSPVVNDRPESRPH